MLSSLFSTTLIFAVALSSVRADTASNSTSDLSSTADLSSSSDLSTADVSTLSSDVVSSPDSLIAAASSFAPKKQCKCIPGDSCFPSDIIWKLFGLTTGGRLIKTKPVAVSCYPGPDQNAARCAVVNANWQDATFQADDVVGLAYPTNVTCPPVPAGQTPGSCTLGVSPSYAVDATEPWHVSVAVAFARLSNIRLVVKNTGHDMLGRSEGAGGLEVWIRHLRKGITFQKKFKSDTGCTKSGWTGSAIKIAGAYTWGDVYATAKANNVIVVGGGTPSVGAIGGWMQGGGHGPASRQFGLGADQVLELDVVLSSGLIVTANACQNSDLFFALRGGGGGTYGVVISTTVKAHPNAGMVVQHLAMGALTTNTTGLLDTIAIVTSAYPDMNDAGYAGYGQWSIESPTPIFATFTAAYVHGIYMFGKTEKDARAAFDATRAKLAPYSSSVFVSETYTTYPDYWSFYEAESGVEPPVGTPATLASRLFDRPSLTKDFSALRKMIGTLAGTPGQFTFNSVEIVGGGQIFKDKSDPNSGLLPAWRTSYFSNIVARGYPLGTPQSVVDQIQNDITFTKLAAMKALAPNTGSYMNEADRLDPDWKNAFYGSNYNKLLGIKQKYDPASVFFCPTCVGSDGWGEDGSRRLCKVNSS